MKKQRENKINAMEQLAGEIYDLNKKNGYKNPYSRSKAIKIMVNGSGTEKGFGKSELKEMRNSLLNKNKNDQAERAITKVNTLNPKVAKADELRRIALKAGEKATKIAKQSSAEMAAAQTQTEKTAVRAKYTQKRKKAKLEAGQAFLNYDNYLQKTFGIDNPYIETNEAYTGTETGFIDWLQAKFTKRKKK